MATVDQCRSALDELAARLSAVDASVRSKHASDRSLSLRVHDLDVVFCGRIHDGELVDVLAETDPPKAQIRLACSSDDLLALIGGELSPASAWATGKLRVEASPLDLLRLRSLL